MLINETQEYKIIAPGSKLIVKVQKDKDALAFNLKEVNTGNIVSVGDDCSESVREAVLSYCFFGSSFAQVPSITEDDEYLYIVMEESNLMAIYTRE